MEFLKVENLCKTYGKGENAVQALNNVSFTLPKGQMTAVIGPSGSGKSTLLHILGGVEKPSGGKVYLNGEDVFAQKEKNMAVFRRRQVGLIYQFYNLIPVLNVEENITLPMELDGRKINKERLDALLKLLNLEQRKLHLPSQLSGGQQQRVSIARAMYNNPALLLADEPTGNLDSKNSRETINMLRESNLKYNQTMLIITHNENIALQCDRIITISDGKIIKDEVIR